VPRAPEREHTTVKPAGSAEAELADRARRTSLRLTPRPGAASARRRAPRHARCAAALRWAAAASARRQLAGGGRIDKGERADALTMRTGLVGVCLLAATMVGIAGSSSASAKAVASSGPGSLSTAAAIRMRAACSARNARIVSCSSRSSCILGMPAGAAVTRVLTGGGNGEMPPPQRSHRRRSAAGKASKPNEPFEFAPASPVLDASPQVKLQLSSVADGFCVY
jgi:hypothetical protein